MTPAPARTWLRDNGLTLTLMLLFAVSVTGHALAGFSVDNHERLDHLRAPLTFGAYLLSGQFLGTLFENWESEFLQMSAYVVLTAYLMQRGSPESRDLDEDSPQDRDPDPKRKDAPRAVRRGGLALKFYSHSLGAALFGLFLISFALHWINSRRAAVDEALMHHQPPPSLLAYLTDAHLWFESFQNWQSEFLSTAVLIVLAIFLREKGSPESKPVDAPHRQTGTG